MFRLKFSSKNSKNPFYFFLKELLGFKPGMMDYYDEAFIHRSASVQTKNKVINNERLEFLGDSVLDAVISEYLFERYPKADEGYLSNLRSRIVNGNQLNTVAEKMGFEKFLKTNISDFSNSKKNFLGDSFEALIGAIYLDKGYIYARQFIFDKFLDRYIDWNETISSSTNYKGLLIEWCQKNKKDYQFNTSESILHENGNSHYFSVIVIDGKESGKGTGTSKKEAEQVAAKEAYEKL